MDRDELIENIRARVEKCRRLAASTSDDHVAETLRQMAEEGEADLRRLIAENK